MKKNLVVLALAAVMVMAFVPSAFALHGAYNSTGASCAECHKVHDAESAAAGNLFIKAPSTVTVGAYQQNTGTGGPGLAPAVGFTNSNTEALCEYCHVYGGHVIDQVYGSGLQGNGSTMAAHKIGETVVPNSSGAYTLVGNGTAGGLGCVDCHNALPHAAKSGKTWTNGSSTLTMADPTGAVKSMYTKVTGVDLTPYGGAVIGTASASVNQFCARCHDKNMTLTAGGTTHVLTTATTMDTTNYGTGVQVAWNGSETCIKCHAVNEFHSLQAVAGQTIPTVGAIGSSTALVGSNATGTAPFQTYATEATGTAFTVWGQGLGYGGGTNKKVASEVADGLCLSCHMKSDSSSGVGVTF